MLFEVVELPREFSAAEEPGVEAELGTSDELPDIVFALFE
jgi:hypothetical protein